MALGVEGVRVGTWTAPERISGCTVILPPAGTVGACAVRGAAPGTREAAALGPQGKVEVCHGVVLSGGSAFGLATADGVMRWLEQRGVGYPVATARVPIVGAAIILDASVADPAGRPDAIAGRAACVAAGLDDPAEGSVGVGAGCTVAKVAGREHGWRGGQGLAVVEAAGVTVGVLVANNAVGEVMADDGTWIARARVPAEAPRFPTHGRTLHLQEAHGGEVAHREVTDQRAPGGGPGEQAHGDPPGDGSGGPTANTAIGCVVTNAQLTKLQAHRVADLAHSGLARALRPVHTEADGDAMFCLATGRVPATPDLVSHLAVEAVAIATRRGPQAAVGGGGLPGLADG